MARKAAIPFVDLFDLTDRINSVLPPDIQDLIGRFGVIEHDTRRSDGAVIHHGKIQSINAAFDSDDESFDIGIGTLALPLVHGGLPFQLSMSRAAVTGNLEPGANAWQLNLFLADFILTIDGLVPAIYVPETGTAARHLLRDPNNSKVRIIGSAVLRLQKTAGSNSVDVLFVDQPDPLDPALFSGAVAQLTFSPAHFFLGSSDVGLTVGQLLFDFSESYSPPFVLEHNQGPAWVGLAIREATVYAPRNLPVLGDLSGGVRDLLLGSPMGIQGEFELQFGRSALDPATFQFKQSPTGPDLPVATGGTTAPGMQTARVVTIEAGQDEDVTIHAGFTAPAPPTDGTLPTGALQDWTARWTWGTEATIEGDSSSGTVRHGRRLTVEPIEIVTVDGTPQSFNHPPITFRFVAAGDAPAVSATVGSENFANVVHLNGTVMALGFVSLTASSTAPGTSRFAWDIEGNNFHIEGATCTPDLSGLTGQHFIVLKEQVEGEDTQRVTRIRVRIVDEGALLIGCEGGVFDATDDNTALNLAAVEATFDLSDFHAGGEFNTKREQAILNAAAAANVDVPNDGLAQVTLSDAPPATVQHDRHVQILMEFEEDVVTRWGTLKPTNAGSTANERDLQIQLLEWSSHYPGADFMVIGRCDDIGEDVPGESPDSFNITLAKDRAKKGRELLTTLLAGATGTVIDNVRVFTRGETSVWDSGSGGGAGLETDADIQHSSDNPEGISSAGQSTAVGDATLDEGWLIKHEHEEHVPWVNELDTSLTYESTRQTYRRVDIYAVGGSPTDAAIRHTGEPERAPSLRRSMVPANDRTPAPIEPAASAIDYRVKLLIRWDSPTVTRWEDAIPTVAEAEFAWTPEELPLPQVDGQDVPANREVYTVYAKWVHDARTGFTRTTLGLRSDGDPNGLFYTDQKNFTAAMAFGPMLLSGVDFDTDVVGSGARVAALLGAAAFATVDLGGGPLVGDGSRTAFIALEAEAQTRSIADPGEDYQIKVTAEYTTTIHVNGGVLGIKTAADRPMKIRYKDVGIEYDHSKTGWDKVGLAYDTTSMQIEDGGKWEIDGVLGELLRIVEIAFGHGSLWVEGRIAIAISIGVIEISEAIIRLVFKDGDPDPRFELRGFVLKADIPAVLKGEGRLRIEDGGVIRAGVEADIIPLGLGASAAIALAKPPEIDPDVFLSLFLGVQFSTPLPLAQSGAAIYGFKGMFTMNGSRKLPSNPDPIARELDWWATPPESKYEPDSGQYAIGVGVVVGTMPDVSFCFSASGMVVVAFPDPEVIIGVDVKVIEVPDTTVSDEGAPEGTITGLIVIDDEAVKVAVTAQYEIPKVLSLKVPFGAYFPYSGEGIYVRLGSDGVTATLADGTSITRHGEPITITLLPDTLNVQAWAYLMIEQGGLPSLGGNPDFTFDGFSVGFGAGWGIKWSAGPIKLSASAKVLVGFGTKPLLIKGGVFVAGELDLVVLSISARGELILTYFDDNIFLEGEFCGEVDMFFFSIKGCVGISIGGTSDFEPPEPEPPIVSVSLTDRKDRIMGSGTSSAASIAGKALFDITDAGNNEGAPPSDNHTVWPDTAPVLHFSHYVANALGSAGQFDPPATPTQPIWFGGNRLKYTYRLDGLELRRVRDNVLVTGDSDLLATWMTTPYRQPDSSGEDNPIPSEHEGPNLKLLDWNPWSWVVNMTDGAESTDGDPAEEVEDLCDPVPQPRRACVYGRSAVGRGWHVVRLRQESPSPPPYPSRFVVDGEPVVRAGGQKLVKRDLQLFIAGLGGSIIPGRIASLPFPVTVDGGTLQKGYALPFARRAVEGGLQTFALPWEGLFDREVSRPTLKLLVCDAPGQVGDGKKRCTVFEGVRPDGKTTQLAHGDVVIRAMNPRDPFTLRDLVDTRNTPDRLGQDGNADVSFPPAGLDIRFRRLCTQIELHFIKQTDAPIDIKAVGPGGSVVATMLLDGPQSTPLVARLNAVDGIAQVFVTGGGNECYLYRICCIDFGDDRPDPEPEHVCLDFRTVKPSDRRRKKLSHDGHVIVPVARNDHFTLVDWVDQRSAVAIPGKDGGAEVLFPDDGIRITLDKPCQLLEVWVMLFASEQVHVIGLDASGREVASANSPPSERRAHRLPLRPRRRGKISQVIVKGGGSKSVVFRICCLDDALQTGSCMSFAGARIDRGATQFDHAGMRFVDLSNQGQIKLRDAVDASRRNVVPGSDGINDLQFGQAGLRIKLSAPCQLVRVHVMLSGGAVKGMALNALGARVARAVSGAQQKVEHILTFVGSDIRAIELFGGSSEAFVFKICCEREPRRATSAPTDDFHFARDTNFDFTHARAQAAKTVTVRGIVGEEIDDSWPGTVLETHRDDGRNCQVIEYAPQRDGRAKWDGFQIRAPLGKLVTVLCVCGTDQIMVDAREDDQAARTARLALLGNVMALPVEERREVLLEPGEEYVIEASWSYQSWQSNDDGTDLPPTTPPSADWIPAGSAQQFFFRVADEEIDSGNTQDGLNEYVFDARDVQRHLYRLEPFDGRDVHFTDDPLWVHFDAGHIEQLLEQYDRELYLEVKRTDPPPQSGGRPAESPLPHVPGTFEWLTGPITLLPLGYQRINAAIAGAPCLPDGPAVGGASVRGEFDLDPYAMYDFAVLARRLGSGSDPMIVSATRFTTSRYANPDELVTDLGYSLTGTAPYRPDDILLPAAAVVPGGAMEVSDGLLDALLQALDVDTLPLPTRQPKSYIVWRQDGASWLVEGLLIDSFESLNREGAVQTVSGSDIVTRFKVAGATVGGNTMTVHRANENWTRVYLRAATPFALASGRHDLALNFDTSTGGLTGRRSLSHQPALIEREGL